MSVWFYIAPSQTTTVLLFFTHVAGEVLFSKQKIEENVKQKKEELVDSFMNIKKDENTNSASSNHSKDPFAFLDKETNRRHSDSHVSQFQTRNGTDRETEFNRKHFVRYVALLLSGSIIYLCKIICSLCIICSLDYDFCIQ